jgi:hypothetical protein
MTEQYNYRSEWMTDDQWECAQMFSDVVGGFHHVLGKFQPYGSGIKINTRSGRWATWDYDSLTRLVILGHDRMIRVDLGPSGPNTIRFCLWKRHSRDGAMHERHPTIEQAIERHRHQYT